jgi:hypothetical protein
MELYKKVTEQPVRVINEHEKTCDPEASQAKHEECFPPTQEHFYPWQVSSIQLQERSVRTILKLFLETMMIKEVVLEKSCTLDKTLSIH